MICHLPVRAFEPWRWGRVGWHRGWDVAVIFSLTHSCAQLCGQWVHHRGLGTECADLGVNSEGSVISQLRFSMFSSLKGENRTSLAEFVLKSKC